MKIHWEPTFKRNISLFEIWIANKAYIKGMQKMIGKGFKNTLFVSRLGIEQSYRAQEDNTTLFKFLRNTLRKKPELVIKARNYFVNNMNRVIKVASRFTLSNLRQMPPEQLMDRFREITQYLYEFYTVFHLPLQAEQAIGKEGSRKLKRVIRQAGLSRDKVARQLELLRVKWMTNFFKELSHRLKIPTKHLMHILPSELPKLFENPRPLALILAQRYRFYVLLTKSGKPYLFTDAKAQKILQEELRNLLVIPTTQQVLKGIVAYPGQVIAKVALYLRPTDKKKRFSNKIVVTSMTTPEIAPYLKRVKGIVTDEGGMLCHAAILSRELKTPCIIGTKIATRVLKDGDLVEIDANEEIIRILKRKK